MAEYTLACACVCVFAHMCAGGGGASVIWCLEPWVLTILLVQRTGPRKDLSCPECTLPAVEKLVKEKTELTRSESWWQ